MRRGWQDRTEGRGLPPVSGGRELPSCWSLWSTVMPRTLYARPGALSSYPHACAPGRPGLRGQAPRATRVFTDLQCD